MDEATVETVGVADDQPVVVLTTDDRELTVPASQDQAHAIGLALSGEPFPRPLSHDLLVELVTDLGGAVDRAVIVDGGDGEWDAELHAEQYHGGERRELVFEARASDAIAVALRSDCPVYVTEAVLDAADEQAGVEHDGGQ